MTETHLTPKQIDAINTSPNDWVVCFILVIFLGFWGVHRFYVRKIGTGILMLLTFGGLGIWWFIDLILIAVASFRDKEGRQIPYNNTPLINPKNVKSEIDVLKKIGAKIIQKKNSLIIKKGKSINKINIITKPYPGFPTDLQAQLMVLLTQANGKSKIKENIFENRFMHVPELKRMGAHIEIKDRTAIIKGPTKLTGAEVMATDLRASVCLVLAGLIANNRTIVNRIYHLDRGYEFLENKLKNCKAIIKRV